jgi:hypothetical protein
VSLIKEEVPVLPVKPTRTIETIACDLCPAVCAKGTDEWNSDGSYEHDEVQIQTTHRTRYPEGGSQKGMAFDCCPNCFKTKVQPALEALGLKPREIEISW